jgi:hypothetical protein
MTYAEQQQMKSLCIRSINYQQPAECPSYWHSSSVDTRTWWSSVQPQLAQSCSLTQYALVAALLCAAVLSADNALLFYTIFPPSAWRQDRSDLSIIWDRRLGRPELWSDYVRHQDA